MPSAIDLPTEHLAIVRAILRIHVPGRPVWVFGSRVRGRPKPSSDLDLCVFGDSPLSPATRAELESAFAESDLPIKVDVVEWALATTAFRDRLAADHVVIQP